MLGLLQSCFPDRIAQWEPTLKDLIPSYGTTLNDDAARAEAAMTATADALHINR